MTYNHRVKNAFTYNFGNSRTANVPAGARAQSASAHGGGFRWVDPTTFPANSFERFDATYYGIRVFPDNYTSEEA
jgi:hypothetical protein